MASRPGGTVKSTPRRSSALDLAAAHRCRSYTSIIRSELVIRIAQQSQPPFKREGEMLV